ncbi:hypothetical protein D3C80_1520010 [compost metagenome]
MNVALFRFITQKRKYVFGIIQKAVENILLKPFSEIRIILHQLVKSHFIQDVQFTFFQSFQTKTAWLKAQKTFQRSYQFAFKEKLTGDFTSVFIQPNPQSTFFNDVHLSGNRTFQYQLCSRRNGN